MDKTFIKKMKYLRFTIVLIAALFLTASCLEEEGDQDKVEEIILNVSAETSFYYDLFDAKRENPIEGMLIQERGSNHWECIHFQEIDGFTYEKGYDYELLVEKTTLANPPQDGSNVRYSLIKIIEKRMRYID